MVVTCVLAHINHGKTTLLDCLLSSQSLLSKRNMGIKLLDTRDDEQSRGITLKLSFIKLRNLFGTFYFIDTPGHFDIESCLESAMFISDSTLLIVDLCEGVTQRTVSLLRFVGDKSVLFINKVDKFDNYHHYTSDDSNSKYKYNDGSDINIITEDMYKLIKNLIGLCNAILGRDLFDYEKNNVVIGSSLRMYGFNKGLIENILGKEATKGQVLSKDPSVLSKNPSELNNKPSVLSKNPSELNNKPSVLSKNPSELNNNPSKKKLPEKKDTFKNEKQTLKNHLKRDLKFFSVVKKEVFSCNKEKILKRFKISNWSSALCEIFPLSDCIFMSLNTSICNEESKKPINAKPIKYLRNNVIILQYSFYNISSLRYLKDFDLPEYFQEKQNSGLYKLEDKFKSLDIKYNKNNEVSFTGITTTAVAFHHIPSNEEIILFVVRPFSGRLIKGAIVYSETMKELKHTVVKKIFSLEGLDLLEVDSFDEKTGFCFVEADFLKKSYLFEAKAAVFVNSAPVCNNNSNETPALRVKPTLKFTKQPFYQYTLIPISPISTFKQKIQRLSLTENLLKAKINKFSEIELLVEGKIHLEKLLFDLKDLEFKEGDFREILYFSTDKEVIYTGEGFIIKISEVKIAVEDVSEAVKKGVSLEKFYREKLDEIIKIMKINNEPMFIMAQKYTQIENKFEIQRKDNFIIKHSSFNDLSILIYSLPKLFNVILSIEIFENKKIEFNDLFRAIKNLVPENVVYLMAYEISFGVGSWAVGGLFQSLEKFGYVLVEHTVGFENGRLETEEFSGTGFGFEKGRLETEEFSGTGFGFENGRLETEEFSGTGFGFENGRLETEEFGGTGFGFGSETVRVLVRQRNFKELRDEVIDKLRGEIVLKISEVGYIKDDFFR
ncbi:Elongation factor-like GTPase 1 [Cucumispora dikerogammari]|nr:Elongation factor-like GTPase 1 [Cucumispora dikerogammari]